MSQSNEELAGQLRGLLGQTGLASALGDEGSGDADPLESDFFRALNAFRAARTKGDQEEMAAAERRLQDVVRSELTGGSRP